MAGLSTAVHLCVPQIVNSGLGVMCMFVNDTGENPSEGQSLFKKIYLIFLVVLYYGN